jgi:putative membrane protein
VSRATRLLAVGYGLYLLYVYWSGALYFYIHPLYAIPTLVSGLVLLGLAMLVPATDQPGPRRGLAAVGLAVPLLLGILVPPQPLGLSSAAQRGVELGPIAGVESPAPLSLGLAPEAYTIKDWVKAFQADPEPGRHAGKPARVSGFVYRSADLPADWFLVARFVVKCCAVDAQPVGLPVRAPGPVPAAGQWVAVEGAWEVVETAGSRKAVIAATRVTPVPRPDQPYLY